MFLEYSFLTVCTGLPPDVMHDVLEGCLQLEIKCLLNSLIVQKKLFSLSFLNERITDFPYGPDASDHPPQCLSDTCTSMSSGSTLKLGGELQWFM